MGVAVVERVESAGQAVRRLAKDSGRTLAWIALKLDLSRDALNNRLAGRVLFNRLEREELGRIFDADPSLFLTQDSGLRTQDSDPAEARAS